MFITEANLQGVCRAEQVIWPIQMQLVLHSSKQMLFLSLRARSVYIMYRHVNVFEVCYEHKLDCQSHNWLCLKTQFLYALHSFVSRLLTFFSVAGSVLDLRTTLLEASSHCFHSSRSVFIWQPIIEPQTGLLYNYWQIMLLTDSSPQFFIIMKLGGVCPGLCSPRFHNYLDKYPCLSQSHIVSQWQIFIYFFKSLQLNINSKGEVEIAKSDYRV